MPRILVISHPEVVIDPAVPIPDWGLSDEGRRRAGVFAASEAMHGVTAIWSSDERKATETADILARPGGLSIRIDPRLAEIDRSATGYLPRAAFEAAADAHFAQPEASHLGWERATDAQARMVEVFGEITGKIGVGDLAIVTHGAVATHLWCHLMGLPIDRRHDQPGQGHYWQADAATLRPAHGWRPIS